MKPTRQSPVDAVTVLKTGCFCLSWTSLTHTAAVGPVIRSGPPPRFLDIGRQPIHMDPPAVLIC